MEAPERIYIHPTLDNLYGMRERSCDSEIEYVRIDTFVKKACDWIKYNNENGSCLFDGWEEDFKNYMKA